MKTGQYEDAYSPSVRMLFDDDEVEGNSGSEEVNRKKENKTTK
jgi:nitrogen fixation-related uncharacterized protein